MNNIEKKLFISSIHPFNNLTEDEINFFVDNIELVTFTENEIIQDTNSNSKFLYIILNGVVQENYNDEILSIFIKNQMFDPISLIKDISKNVFFAKEQTTCYALPRNIFIQILHNNEFVEKYFFQSISDKLNNYILNEKNKDLTDIMLAKVKDARIHKAVIIDANSTIFEAASIIKKEKIPAILLKDDNKKLYIATDSDFRQKVILNRMDFDEKIIKISSSGLIYVDENDFLFNAQLIMAKHGLKRLIVKNKKEEIIGILDQISLSSFFSTNIFSVSNQIEKAETLEELKEASLSFIKIINSLNAKGVKIKFISKLIHQLNKKLLNKLYNLLAPNQLLYKSCLIVMGSEGRAEQILRTDQDNALIIADDCEISKEELEKFTTNFTNTLVDFGFPRCNGNIMISNEYWCKKFSDFKDLIYKWIHDPNEDSIMNVAIFYDAFCVSGSTELLNNLKQYLLKLTANSQTFYAQFAKIVLNFDVPLNFFDGFVFNKKSEDHKNEINIKKGGIFIIVHGVRSLSLENHIKTTNTTKRIKKLKELKIIESDFANELITVFDFLQSIKLKANLDKLKTNSKIDDYINPNDLIKIEQELLKDCFKIINKFKKILEFHYKLDYV